MIFVRADDNNHYFKTLKNSGIWDAYCGSNAYDQMKVYSGFDIKEWIESNVNWEIDFNAETMTFLKQHKLDQYLIW